MTTANASPMTSDDGGSNSPKLGAADLHLQAVDVGSVLHDHVAHDLGVRPGGVLGHLDVGVGDLAGLGSLAGDLELAAGGVRAGDGDVVPRVAAR